MADLSAAHYRLYKVGKALDCLATLSARHPDLHTTDGEGLGCLLDILSGEVIAAADAMGQPHHHTA
jgi:hypothetical protein